MIDPDALFEEYALSKKIARLGDGEPVPALGRLEPVDMDFKALLRMKAAYLDGFIEGSRATADIYRSA